MEVKGALEKPAIVGPKCIEVEDGGVGASPRRSEHCCREK